MVFLLKPFRAGFEPCRARATTLVPESAGIRKLAGRCNPHAWLKSGAVDPLEEMSARRAEIFALPNNFGGHFAPFAGH
jgi:hypothetical protein